MDVNSSTVGLFNMALALIGGTQLSTVETTWEDSAIGILCINNFPMVLDQALEAHPWSFARDRKILALSAENQTSTENQTRPRQGYRFRYALPAGCIRPIELTGGRPFVLEGGALLTEAAPAELHYIQRVSEPGRWPPGFQTALAWGLAAVLATARVNDPQKQLNYFQHYKIALNEAMALDNQMQMPTVEPTPWERGRMGGRSRF